VQRFSAQGGRGVSLRFGLFYGPETRSTGEQLSLARKGLAPFPGAPDAYLSSIHTDDAATAVVAALDLPTGVYNVCDEPVRRRDAANALAAAFGLRKQHFVPKGLVKLATRNSSDVLMRAQRVANAKFRAATGWQPKYRSLREGWPAVAAARS
jgi:nucleoside-diphosphate-sugar epimerase